MGGVLFTTIDRNQLFGGLLRGWSPGSALGDASGAVLLAEPGFGALLNQVPDGNIRNDHLPGHA